MNSSAEKDHEEKGEAQEQGEQEEEDVNDDLFDGCLAPTYQPILSTGEDDEQDRVMLGYAAYHGPSYIPAEVKDNVEHFLAHNRMPSFIQRFVGRIVLGRDDEGFEK